MNEYLFMIPIAIALMVGVVSPGPSFIYIAQTAMATSRSQGIATSLGLGTGAVIYTLVASLGLFFVLETVPWIYIGLKFAGGLYLCYLATKIWNSANEPLDSSEEYEVNASNKKVSFTKAYLSGLFIQLSNPKTAVVIGGIIMAFLPSEVPAYSYLLLALLAFVIDAGWYSIVTVALATAKAQKVYLKFKKGISRVASGLLGLLGVKLIFNQ